MIPVDSYVKIYNGKEMEHIIYEMKRHKRIKEYIENQLREDMMSEQLTLDVVDPFTGNQK